ncbi:hypothetical protein BDZ45DRAFT_719523 [Acephala macrosclerotiorum]|nr:hypothetical protein BDZ45DRAFT_719523 [Acephala macrosclerotiorum]
MRRRRVVLEPSMFCCPRVAEIDEVHGYQQQDIKNFMVAITRTPGVSNSPTPLPESQANGIDRTPYIFRYHKLYNSDQAEGPRYFIPDPLTNDYHEISSEQYEHHRARLDYTDEGQYVKFKCWDTNHAGLTFRIHRLVHINPNKVEVPAVKRPPPRTPPADYDEDGEYRSTKIVGPDNGSRGQMWVD